ncbi:leucine rich repeat (LRR) protein [Maribacter vaceletii]|uniref:Leucine rich repeat (LRR) protein n=1 Tax=Maribacter vaceletii TaxID=1206816 RepID=A0A495EDT3_9FLAO|nr:TIR domain-containing protein [Maribacter vaceletii]RKR14799.1 leucine rich repeat (LRR) protein [Maribacter vaceletii]
MIKIPSKNISKLDLSNQNLTQFPLEIVNLKNLKKLNLSGNKIKHIPKEIERLKNLEQLDLSKNLINNFYSKICSLKKLKVLNLNNNQIKTIPKQIENLDKLNTLTIANNIITSLPITFSNLKNLKKLNLSKNNLDNFPSEILELDSLTHLWMNELNIQKSFSKEMINKLKTLNSIYCYSQNRKSTKDIYLQLSKHKGNSIKKLRNNSTLELKKIRPSNMKKQNILKNKIFISYSHKDKLWLEKVQTNLKAMGHSINEEHDVWDDTKIKVGDKWRDEIENALENARIAILIISTEFLASDFIQSDELPTLLRNAKNNGTRILPLIVGHCFFNNNKNLSEFQAINSPEKPLNSLTPSEIEKQLLNLTKEVYGLLKS